MAGKRDKPEEIVLKLRQVKVLQGQGMAIGEARILIERWRRHYNTIRPHSSLGYRPPAPVTILPPMAKSPYPQTVRALS
jgi:hypothetical protein